MPKHLGLCGESDWVSYEDDNCDCDLIKEARSEVLADLWVKVKVLYDNEWIDRGQRLILRDVLALFERSGE